MNIQNLLAQLGSATNPMTMMMNILNPNQRQMLNIFKEKNNQGQAQMIADYCNKNNISKEQLKDIINMIPKK